MTCKDIPDQMFIDAVLETQPMHGDIGDESAWRFRGDVAVTLASKMYVPEIPERLLLAKADKLIKRGLMAGCACGCRGDFRIDPYNPNKRKT